MSKPAEIILQSMGITDPMEIDVIEIAKEMGADVKLEKPPGCEASIRGFRDKAIIHVDPDTKPERVRFSTAHECGHWQLHRGRAFECRKEDIGNPIYSITNPERMADEYAADLLMPKYLFEPRSGAFEHVGFNAVNSLKTEFNTSFLATALRLVDLGPEPSILIRYDKNGKQWHRTGNEVSSKWFPIKSLDHESYAYDILGGDSRHSSRRWKTTGDTWFDFDGANKYDLYEETITYHDGILTIITFAEPDNACS